MKSNKTSPTLTEICKLLHKELGNEGLETADVPKVQQVLSSYTSCKEDWEKFALVQKGKYTRNLVDDGNGKFNLMILCWDAGVSSAIHDHSNSHCLVKILDGSLVESLYDWPEKNNEKGSVGLVPRKNSTYTENQVTYMHDKIGLHRISNHGSKPAISLHLYSPPFDVCKTFCEKTGCERASGKCVFYSVNGVKNNITNELKEKYAKDNSIDIRPEVVAGQCKSSRKL
jgi:cysteine dioxygenase